MQPGWTFWMLGRFAPTARKLWEWSATVANDPAGPNVLPLVERKPPPPRETLTERAKRLLDQRHPPSDDEGPDAA